MKSKIEERLDKEFEKMEIKPYIYHFVEGIEPFAAITIVEAMRYSWNNIKDIVDTAMKNAKSLRHNKASEVIRSLHYADIYGVAICDRRDQFNRKLGRVIAKGRLLKHLKENPKNC